MRALGSWTSKRGFLILGGLLCASFGGASGCQSVAGIEQRSFDGPSAACDKYCTTVMENCTGEFAVYKTREICLDVCKNLDPGDSEASGNTLACRQVEAQTAKLEKASCANAGPGGNGICGTDCEAWCGLLEKACPDDFDDLAGDCEGRCAALADDASFNVGAQYYSGDTLQCRLIHVGAALSAPAGHCKHAAFNATETCVAGADEEPTCQDVCRVTQNVCKDELAVWESEEQCLEACKVFDVGTGADMTENTVGCRKYHAGVAGSAPGTHCRHASPTGDGTCGTYSASDEKLGNCESYCLLVEAACWEDPAYPFPSREDCENTCEAELANKGAKAGSNYTVATAESGDTLQCRTLHAVRALEAKATDLCDAAYGGDPCR